MSSPSSQVTSRIKALDGLRGLAMILVFLSHVDGGYILRHSLLSRIFFDSGVIGVSWLFILSGFLMAYLYAQPKSNWDFLQKRYTRIFPLFLSLTTAIFVLKWLPTFWWLPLLSMLLMAGVGHLIWVYGVKRQKNWKLNRSLFVGFLMFQVLVGVGYWWVTRQPPPFYDQLPTLVRDVFIWLVNLSLTLPIGNLVPMLDPVFWSLAAEVLFYIVYALVIVKILPIIKLQTKTTKWLVVAALLPFCLGLAFISDKVLATNLLRWQLFYYFVTGMALGYWYRSRALTLEQKSSSLVRRLANLGVILLGLTLVLLQVLLGILPLAWIPVIQAVFAIPFTLLVALLLIPNTVFSKVFSHKWLTWIGEISFSIYLTHFTMFGVVNSWLGRPTGILGLVLYVVVTAFLTLIISYLTHYLLERPYFKRSAAMAEVKPAATSHFSSRNAGIYLSLVSLSYLSLVVVTSLVGQPLLTLVQRFPIAVLTDGQLANHPVISLKDQSVVSFEFKASDNNLGQVILPVIHRSSEKVPFKSQQLQFRIKEANASKWLSTTNLEIADTGLTIPQEFGFPLIADSAGKKYQLELRELEPTASEQLDLETRPAVLSTVSFFDKKSLLAQPTLAVHFVMGKVWYFLTTPIVEQELLLFAPLGIINLYLIWKMQLHLQAA